MKIRIKLRNGQRIIASSYGFGAVDCRGRFYHRSSYKLVEVVV